MPPGEAWDRPSGFAHMKHLCVALDRDAPQADCAGNAPVLYRSTTSGTATFSRAEVTTRGVGLRRARP